jgi:hypothetical protein
MLPRARIRFLLTQPLKSVDIFLFTFFFTVFDEVAGFLYGLNLADMEETLPMDNFEFFKVVNETS